MNRVYTKSGDDGFTTIANGKRIKKYADMVELYGTLDELSVFLGYATESMLYKQDFNDLLQQIYRVQRELYELNSHLVSSNKFTINPHLISKLEIEMDAMSINLPILKSFILPGGGEVAGRIHLARAICRRAERIAFKVAATNDSSEVVGIYLNRLSDWLFVAARTASRIANVEEVLV